MKIAIQTQKGFFAIEASPVEVQGLPCAIHKATTGTGLWTLTHVGTGVALGHGRTRQGAVAAFHHKLNGAPIWQATAKLRCYGTAPDPETLPVWTFEAKPEIDVDALAAEIATKGGVPEHVAAIRAALCGKGKNKGRLLSSAPSAFADSQLAAAAWYGLQPNPFKVSVFSVLYPKGEARALYEKLAEKNWPGWLDADRAALEAFGVW